MAVSTTLITGQKTDIEDLIIFNVSYVADERGFFQEKFNKKKLVEAGMPESFEVLQNSLSHNKDRGVTRGFHAEPWDKYISVVKGKVFAAYVDLRKGPGFGKVITVTLDQQTAIFLPEGVANSFQTLEPDTYYLYSLNKYWSADNYDKYCFVNLADKDIAIDWPIELDKSIISDRDKQHPMLKEIKPMELK